MSDSKRIAKDCLDKTRHLVDVFLGAAEEISHVSPASFRVYAQGKQGESWDQEQAAHIKNLLNPHLVQQQDPIRVFDKQKVESNAAKAEVKKAVEDALAKAGDETIGVLTTWNLHEEFLLRAFQIHCECVNKRQEE